MKTVEKYIQHHIVSWDKLHRDSKELASRLMDYNFKGLVAITRGGLVPAAIVARELEIRLVDTLCISSYNDQAQSKELQILKSIESDGEGLVLIDDLVDTGKTAKLVRSLLPKAHFATVYGKPEGLPMVDTYITEVTQDTWIVFPWDSEIQYIKPLVKVC